MFSRFYRPFEVLDCLFAQGLAGKIPERSEDDFFPASPKGSLAANNEAIQYLCRQKRKNIFFFPIRKMQTFRPALFPVLSFPVSVTRNIGVKYVVCNLPGQKFYLLEEILL